ncbi:MAG TPA: CdaR family protein [Candidatus Sulfotelmatobacter sp.]|nr:CdaR family protein [Candidatus Sulfotelmatobacter sp.]
MRLPGFLTRNLRLKALATVLAGITWVGVVYAGNPPETRTVLVKVPQDQAIIPPGFLLSHPIPDIPIRVAGTREHLDAFQPASLRLVVNYRVIDHPGIQDVPLTVINTDHDVDLDNAPTAVEVTVDRLASATVPVSIDVVSPPPRGYVISGEAANPDRVTAVGPSQELQGMQAKVSVDLSVQKENLQEEFKVFLFDRAGHELKDINAIPATVRLTITISATITSRASAVLPKTTGALPANRQLQAIRVDPPTVVLYGPQELLNALDAIPTTPISLSGVNGDTTLNAKVTPPPGVTASPDSVTVHLSTISVQTPAPASPAPPAPTPSPAPTATPSPSPTR